MVGLYKSINKGDTWVPLTALHQVDAFTGNGVISGKPMITHYYGSSANAGRRSRTLTFNSENSDTIYLVGEDGKDDKSSTAPLNYLFKSIDLGKTWSELSAIANYTNSIILDKNSSSIFYTASGETAIGVKKVQMEA
jgi:hypothetical protein